MLLMMGTADELPAEPVQKTMFVEDMTEQQLASAVSFMSSKTRRTRAWITEIVDCSNTLDD